MKTKVTYGKPTKKQVEKFERAVKEMVEGRMTNAVGKLVERIALDLQEVKATHHDWVGSIVHNSDPTQQKLEYDKHCPACVIKQVLEAIKLEAALATAPPEQAARHGYDCVKVRHETKRSGYLHDELDDGPYDIDGVLYCGRCHIALSRSGN